MGLFDRFRSTPDAPRSTDVTARIGAVAPVSDGESGLAPLPSKRIPADPRQAKARDYAKKVGFVQATYRFIAHQAARPPLIVERSLDGNDWEVVPNLQPDGTPDPEGDPWAWEALSIIKSPAGSQGELIRSGVFLDDTVGEFNLIDVTGITPGIPADQPAFIVRDVSCCTQVKGRRTKTMLISESPGGKVRDGTAFEVDAKRVYRHWQPDELHHLVATSSLIGLVDDLDTYWTLLRRFRRTIRSRLAMNDLLWTPTEAHATKVEVNGKKMSSFEHSYQRMSERAILDTDDREIASIAPMSINTPGSLAAPRVIAMPGIGPELLTYLSDARKLVAASLPLSSAAIFDDGNSSGNHWSDWLADEKDLQTISERLRRVLDTLTAAVFRPILTSGERNGVWTPPEGYTAYHYRIGADVDIIRRSLDNSSNMMWLWANGLVSDEATRRELHARETDAPSPEELEEILARRKKITESTAAAAPAAASAELPPGDAAAGALTAGDTKGIPAGPSQSPGAMPQGGPVPDGGVPPNPATAGLAVIDDLWLFENALVEK